MVFASERATCGRASDSSRLGGGSDGATQASAAPAIGSCGQVCAAAVFSGRSSVQTTIASRSSARVAQRCRSRTFFCRSAKNDFIAAL